MPVALWVESHPRRSVTLRDCGPMRPWLDLLGRQVDLEVVQPGHALHLMAGHRIRHTVLPGLDNPNRFKRKTLEKGTQALRRCLNLPEPIRDSCREVTVIARETNDDFYHGPGSETHMSGSMRRSIPNLRAAAEAIAGTTVVDFASWSPHEQVVRMQGTRVLVGQHGAGLAQMIWMPIGGSVIEVRPPLPPQVENLFERLAHILGHSYRRISQQSVHSPVDPEVLERAIVDEMKSLSSW